MSFFKLLTLTLLFQGIFIAGAHAQQNGTDQEYLNRIRDAFRYPEEGGEYGSWIGYNPVSKTIYYNNNKLNTINWEGSDVPTIHNGKYLRGFTDSANIPSGFSSGTVAVPLRHKVNNQQVFAHYDKIPEGWGVKDFNQQQ